MIEPTEKDIGRGVVYKKDWMTASQWESGVITGINKKFVHVRYGSDRTAKSTLRRDLDWEFESRTTENYVEQLRKKKS